MMGPCPTMKYMLPDVPWGVKKLQRPCFFGASGWGWWWGAKHAKRHIGNAGLSHLVGSCSWRTRHVACGFRWSLPAGMDVTEDRCAVFGGVLWALVRHRVKLGMTQISNGFEGSGCACGEMAQMGLGGVNVGRQVDGRAHRMYK